jgi:hypothetical protein
MLKRLTILAALLAATLFALPTAASAQPPAEEEELGTTPAHPYPAPYGLAIASSNGYGLSVDEGSGHKVLVEANGAHGTVAYSAPGTISEKLIKVDLGKYGRIDMHWVPNGRVREVRLKCHERGVITHFYEAGSYVGTLRFRGGRGFTSVTAHRVAWHRNWYSATRACGFSVSTAEPGYGEVIEAERGGHASATAHLFAYKAHKGAKVEFTAHSKETHGRLEISRSAYVDGGAGSLLLKAASPTTVALDPPAPFYGAATFERIEGSKEGTLTGDLGVEFPDQTKVDLAGKGIEATLHFETIDIYPG